MELVKLDSFQKRQIIIVRSVPSPETVRIQYASEIRILVQNTYRYTDISGKKNKYERVCSCVFLKIRPVVSPCGNNFVSFYLYCFFLPLLQSFWRSLDPDLHSFRMVSASNKCPQIQNTENRGIISNIFLLQILYDIAARRKQKMAVPGLLDLPNELLGIFFIYVSFWFFYFLTICLIGKQYACKKKKIVICTVPIFLTSFAVCQCRERISLGNLTKLQYLFSVKSKSPHLFCYRYVRYLICKVTNCQSYELLSF